MAAFAKGMLELERSKVSEVRGCESQSKSGKHRTELQGKTKGNTPTAMMIAQQGSMGTLPFPVRRSLERLVGLLPSSPLSPLRARKAWIDTACWPMSAVHATKGRKLSQSAEVQARSR